MLLFVLFIFAIIATLLFGPYFIVITAPTWRYYRIAVGAIGGGIVALLFVITAITGGPPFRRGTEILYEPPVMGLLMGALIGATLLARHFSDIAIFSLRFFGFVLLVMFVYLGLLTGWLDLELT